MNSGPTLSSIDFSAYTSGNEFEKQKVAAAVDEALSTTGFFFLRNHGIDENVIQECFKLSSHLHHMPERVKNSLPQPSASHVSGYSHVGNETVRGKQCIKESFACGDPEQQQELAYWPPEDELADFRGAAMDLYKECSALMSQILDCLSLALRLDEDERLNKYHSGSLFNLDFIHYPAVSAELLRNGQYARLPAHSDFGSLTLLFQDDAGGLEIGDPNSSTATTSAEFERTGTFFHVDPQFGCVLVNAGYMLKRWTNGRWKSAIHRVAAPSKSMCMSSNRAGEHEDETVGERYSIAFFGFPDPETRIEALPGCVDDTHPRKWEPLLAGDYLRKKRAGVFAYGKETSTKHA